jgi:uncharacterized membrane protein
VDKRTLRWVYRELPKLVSQGVMPPEVAERIRKHYGDPEESGIAAKRWAIVLFSILGATLIGGGIILLLAHNWEELSRPMRAAISVLPLAVSAGLGCWLLWTQRSSVAWREGVGTIQALAIGSSIALVSQTYNLGGRLDEFMLTWSLLGLPVAYLLGATAPALLYLISITVWVGSVMNYNFQSLWYFLLLGLALPYLWWTGRGNQYHPRPVSFGWVLAITGCIGSGLAIEPICNRIQTWPIFLGGLFSLLFLVGARWWGEASAAWQRPFQNVGALGAMGLSLVLSFSGLWEEIHRTFYWRAADTRLAALELAIAAIFPVAALAWWVWDRRRWAKHEAMLGAMPLVAIFAWTCGMRSATTIAAALFTVYLFVFGVGTLVTGLRGRRLGIVNAGMTVLAAIILCRFFDSNLGFALRGVAFILIGIGFLATNLVLLRRKGAAK